MTRRFHVHNCYCVINNYQCHLSYLVLVRRHFTDHQNYHTWNKRVEIKLEQQLQYTILRSGTNGWFHDGSSITKTRRVPILMFSTLLRTLSTCTLYLNKGGYAYNPSKQSLGSEITNCEVFNIQITSFISVTVAQTALTKHWFGTILRLQW